MATWTEAGETWNTTAGNKTVVATPVANDLIVVVAGASTMAGTDDIVITDNNSDGLGTYHRTARSIGGGTTGMMDIWVRNALIGSASSTTFTATITGDTGGGLTVMRLASVTRTGMGAVRQSVGESSQTESPVVVTFPQATLTANAILLGVLGEDNPAALGPPTSFVETTDTGYLTPTTGVHVCYVDSGQTSAPYTYASGAFTDHNEVGVEINVSAFDAATEGGGPYQLQAGTSGMIGRQWK